MRKKQLYLIICFITFSMFSQTKFEKGYYITSNGEKIEGLIKNMDWRNNPTSIEFKKDENENSQEISFNDFSEFEINGISKYKKFNVKIDKSTNKLKEVTYRRTPIFVEETILLKTLVEGQYSLFKYENDGFVKFFYTSPTNDIEQLIYILFYIDEDTANKYKENGSEVYANITLLKNEEFKKQLYKNVNCNQTFESIDKLEYDKKKLIKYFIENNNCNNYNYRTFGNKKNNKPHFNLKAVANVNLHGADLSYINSIYNTNGLFSQKIGFGVGFEFELFLPFNNNKWSVFAEPTFNSYNDKGKLYNKSTNASYEIEVKYSYIQVPIGLRYNMYLTDKSKLYVNPLYNLRITYGDSDFSSDNVNIQNFLDIFPLLANFGVGVGYSYNNLTAEIRVIANSELVSGADSNFSSKYNYSSFILKYQLF